MNEFFLQSIIILICYIIYKGIKQIVIEFLYFFNNHKIKKEISSKLKPKSNDLKKTTDISNNQNISKSISCNKKLEVLNHSYKTHSKIKIIGIGGGGCNIAEEITLKYKNKYDTLLINSDRNALISKKINKKVYLNKKNSLGCGGNIKCGFNLINNRVINELRDFIYKDKEVYIVATLGGGVGSGSSRAIVKYLSESNIDTKLILIKPFSWEGNKKQIVSEDTLTYLQKYTEYINILNNDDLVRKHSHLSIYESFLMMSESVNNIIQKN